MKVIKNSINMFATLCYNGSIIDTSSLPKCSLCHSPLILISEVTEQIEGSRFSQTRCVYRCSNQECQDERDKQTEKRLQQRDEKKHIDEARAKEKLEQKRLKQEKRKAQLPT
jgi:hypothetical protein